MNDAPRPQGSTTPDAPSPLTISRRELLRRAGWVAPVLIALPLSPGRAFANGYASPGCGASSGGISGGKISGGKISGCGISGGKPSR